jgi:hypothetical protein
VIVQVGQAGLHLPRGAHRPEGVVLAHPRQPEHGHHGVADELLDHPAVAFEHRLHLVEVAGQDLADRFGVQRLPQAG